MIYSVSLASQTYRDRDVVAGSILVTEEALPGVHWATFEPRNVTGEPELVSTAAHGGDFLFRYRVEDGIGFELRARVGIPIAKFALLEEKQLRASAAPEDPAADPDVVPMSFDVGAATTSGRGVMRWRRSGPVVPKVEEIDLLRVPDDAEDLLRKGM